ncbi:MAG: ABC transporter permease [Candidatus Methanofastidiosia archaeon]|jgi:ABC-2 type transport system permease protein
MDSTDRITLLIKRDLTLWVHQWFSPAVIFLEFVTYLVIFAFVLNNLITSLSIEGETISYISFLFPGILVMNFFITSISSGLLTYMDRRLGMLELLLTAPISRQTIVVSRLLSTTIKSLIVGGFLTLIAIPLGVTIQSGVYRGVYVIVCCILFSVAMAGLSIVLTARIQNDQMFNAITNAFNLPLIFSSPLFYPRESMPVILRRVSYFNPLTYGVTPIRSALILETPVWFQTDFLILIVITIVFVFLAVISYNKAMEELHV